MFLLQTVSYIIDFLGKIGLDMKNILKTITILMYLLFFTPIMIAQAESQDI